MEKIEHKVVAVNGLNMHVAELGEGPLVLFLHGFPQLWYTWRHQILFMAERGYRAVAPDLRGYGDTTGAPLEDPSKFSYLYVVGDLIELLEALAPEGDKVFVVGHDWGALIAWQLCLYRPDKVKALVNISVAFSPRNPVIMKPVDALRRVYGDDYYICRFQDSGEIEAEFAQIGVKEVVKNFLAYRTPGPLILPKGKGFGYSGDRPSWLAEEELDYYARKFEKTGFTGGVNYYRAIDLSWELNAPWSNTKVNLPVKFIVGEFDLTYHMPGVKEYVHNGGFKIDVPLLQEVVVVKGAAHFVVEERPDEISEHIYSFLKNF